MTPVSRIYRFPAITSVRSLDPLPSPSGAVAGEKGPFRHRRLLMLGLAASGGAQGYITP